MQLRQKINIILIFQPSSVNYNKLVNFSLNNQQKNLFATIKTCQITQNIKFTTICYQKIQLQNCVEAKTMYLFKAFITFLCYALESIQEKDNKLHAKLRNTQNFKKTQTNYLFYLCYTHLNKSQINPKRCLRLVQLRVNLSLNKPDIIYILLC